MESFLIVFALIILICVFLNRVSSRFGIPVLLLFILVGVMFGVINPGVSAGTGGRAVERICSAALIFIMFYGGFGTSWKSVRPVLKPSVLLASAGVLMTAVLTGIFCRLVLGWNWAESLLLGSVVSSTDAATVFSILRGKRLGLKNNTAPMLEVESGSNDPCAYMLTAIMLSVVQGQATVGSVIWTVFAQIAFGVLGGVLIAQGAVWLSRKFPAVGSGFGSMYILAVAILSYAIPSVLGGNGYLSAYIVGIVMGNTDIPSKRQLVGFFDGVTSLMQILIFFLLGLMARPSALVRSLLPALAIFACLLLVARPAAVFTILAPFRKYSARQMALVSFVGLRGAASIVFAIMAATSGASMDSDIFSIVFCIVLISLLLQGSLIPYASRKLEMTDRSNVMKTFSDFSDTADVSFGCIPIREGNIWVGRSVADLGLPKGALLALVLRDGRRLVPKGDTVIRTGDRVVLCLRACDPSLSASISESEISSTSKWNGRKVSEMHDPHSILLIVRRGTKQIIPNGNTVIRDGDVLVFLRNA